MPIPTIAEPKIAGRATLGLRDIYAAAYLRWPVRVRWAYGIGLGAVLAYTLWLGDVHDADTFDAAGLPLLAGVIIVCIAAWFGMLALFFSRLSPGQKQIDYEIDRERIVIHDAMGSTVIKPWTEVKACSEHRTGFNLRLKPMGSYWMVKRAFKPDELETLRALTVSIMGSSR